MTPSKTYYPAAVAIKIFCTVFVLLFLTGFVQVIVFELYKQFIYSSPRTDAEIADAELTEQEKQQQDIDYAEKEFGTDGTLYLVNYTDVPGVSNERNVVVKDKDGAILFTGKEKDNPYSFIAWRSNDRQQYSYSPSANQDYLNELNMISMSFSRSYTISVVNADNKRIGHWLLDARKRYFAYYSIGGQCGGYLGVNGYSQDAGDAESFADCVLMDSWLAPNSYNPMLLYQTKFAVYQIDFQKKQVEMLVKTEQDPIEMMETYNWREKMDIPSRPMLKVTAKSEKIFLVLKNPQRTIEIQPSEEFRYNYLQIAVVGDKMWCRLREIIGRPKTDDSKVIRAWWDANLNKPMQSRIRLFEIDEAGNFVERNSFAWTRPAYKWTADSYSQEEKRRHLINSFSSRVPGWIAAGILEIAGEANMARSRYCRMLMDCVDVTTPFNQAVNLSLMTLFALLTLVHGLPRRTGVAKLLFWIGFVLLFNLAGFLTYLALNHTPVVRCASCGKWRGLAQDACCRCGAVLPLPRGKETDLLSALSA